MVSSLVGKENSGCPWFGKDQGFQSPKTPQVVSLKEWIKYQTVFIRYSHDGGRQRQALDSLVKQRKCYIAKMRIHRFHIDHNALCLPPKILHTIVLDFSWDDCNTQVKLEKMVIQNSGE